MMSLQIKTKFIIFFYKHVKQTVCDGFVFILRDEDENEKSSVRTSCGLDSTRDSGLVSRRRAANFPRCFSTKRV